MKKIILYSLAGWLALSLSVSAGEKSKEQIQKEHDAAWQKIVEKQKELKEANKRFKKQIEEIIKQLKKTK